MELKSTSVLSQLFTLECYKTFYHSSTIEQSLSELIPDSVLQLIEAESENLQLTGRVVGWTV